MAMAMINAFVLRFGGGSSGGGGVLETEDVRERAAGGSGRQATGFVKLVPGPEGFKPYEEAGQ